MAQITIIRDPQIQQTEIVQHIQQLQNEDSVDAGMVPTQTTTDIQQTKIFGIQVPLLAINGISVDWNDIVYFSLDDTQHVPSCRFKLYDRGGIWKRYAHPGNDNVMRVQILPPFDDTYKKINLTFLVTQITLHQDSRIVEGRAIYNLPAFTQSRFCALGELTTYDLADQISLDTGLGLASNVASTQDPRYMQCSYESYKDLISKEIEKSGDPSAIGTVVYDWWVDCWNNLVLCDIYNRIQDTDDPGDMKIWVASRIDDTGTHNSSEPIEVSAVFSNHPFLERTELQVIDFEVRNQPVSPAVGNSIAMSIYEEDKKESIDHYVTDGDILENEFIKYEYLGEIYGSYNYLLAQRCRQAYLSKIRSEIVILHVMRPQLGLMRGSQCRFVWYDHDTLQSMDQEVLEKTGTVTPEDEVIREMAGWLEEWKIPDVTHTRPMRINLQYSGQYTCLGQKMTYNVSSGSWDSWIYLSRPASARPQLSQI